MHERIGFMKKLVSVLMSALLVMGMFCSCGSQDPVSVGNSESIQVVTTIFPEYDWVMHVLGDNPAEMEVSLLLDNGVDLHSYQPTTEDVLKISTCDLFIYVGGESDAWVDDTLREAANPDMVLINLIDVLGDAVKEEETVEGMQEEEEEEETPAWDEHVWLSLKNTSIFVDQISAALQMADPDHAEVYKKNAQSYAKQLQTLDETYQTTVASASHHTLLFGDRFPFRYLVDDYGLDYYAAFVGCSAETEASFETITFLSQKVDELQLPAVMTIDGSDGQIAETIVANTQTKDQPILVLDSMQSATAKQIADGKTYLSVMEDNLEVLRKALQ